MVLNSVRCVKLNSSYHFDLHLRRAAQPLLIKRAASRARMRAGARTVVLKDSLVLIGKSASQTYSMRKIGGAR
jgi:hypothetical protein